MYNRKEDEIKHEVWSKLIKADGIPVGSNAAVDLAHETEDAINAAILMTAQAIFEEIWAHQHHEVPDETTDKAMVLSIDLQKIEDEWLHNACNFCHSRLPSVIRRKDGKRICARCEAAQPYTEEEIHGNEAKS